MARHHINKEVSIFAHKNISVAPNTQFSILVILLVFLSAAQGKESLHSQASTPDSDTVLYRIDTTIRKLHHQFWQQNLAFLRQNKKKLRTTKCYVVIDETYDSYTGNIHKKPLEELTPEQRKNRRYIHKYKPKNGDTGSYKYLVFALVYQNTRRVIRIKALRRGESYWSFVAETLQEIHREIKFDCALMDRGFYVSTLVNLLEKKKIPYLIRARLYDSTRSYYGIYSEWKSYDYRIDNWAKTKLVLGRDHRDREWGFLTNMQIQKLPLLLKIYKKRWNIENIFKATDGIQLRVATSNHITRLFAVCLSFLVYNAWQEKKKYSSLLGFLKKIVGMILRIIRTVCPHRDRLKLNVPLWNFVQF